ncbi:dihydroorotase [Lewinellaceae bacterium SD302]|nr:dihydroorotase [Lewinellaceae bacterium SD302]
MPLLRNILVTDSRSAHNGQLVDLRITDDENKIAAIGKKLPRSKDEIEFDLKGVRASPGFIDLGPYLGDPGHEEREDLESLALAAARGGYVAVAPLPDAKPVRHDKSGISYLLDRSKDLAVDFLPLGAISQDLSGTDITEMLDMHAAGAIGFTDAPKPVASAGLMSRALHYVKAFGGLVINQPLDRSLAPHGQLHEGTVSTGMGIPGLPPISEHLMLYRDLELLEYAESALLVHLVSTVRSLEMIRAARQKGLDVSASVAALNLQFTDEAVSDFDPNFKVLPPLRSASDRDALIKGLREGTLDLIVSNHQAHETESKDLEFAYAEFGATALQSCFAQAVTVLGSTFEPAEIAAFFSHGPRRALRLPALAIEEGATASLSFFDLEATGSFAQHPATEKGLNNGLIGRELTGRPVATFRAGKLRYCSE